VGGVIFVKDFDKVETRSCARATHTHTHTHTHIHTHHMHIPVSMRNVLIYEAEQLYFIKLFTLCAYIKILIPCHQCRSLICHHFCTFIQWCNFIYIYIYIYICVCVCVYVYTYTKWHKKSTYLLYFIIIGNL